MQALQSKAESRATVQYRAMPKEQDKALQEKDHQIADLKRKIHLLEEEISRYKSAPEDEEIVSNDEEENPWKSTDADHDVKMEEIRQKRFAFLCCDEAMLSRLLKAFPNSVDAQTCPFDSQPGNALTAVVVITSKVKHGDTARVKNECIRKQIPYFACNTINMDRVTEEIAIQLNQLEKEKAC